MVRKPERSPALKENPPGVDPGVEGCTLLQDEAFQRLENCGWVPWRLLGDSARLGLFQKAREASDPLLMSHC